MVATTLSGVCAALLNANHRFLASALVWVAANVVTISMVIALHSQLGIFALVLGSVLAFSRNCSCSCRRSCGTAVSLRARSAPSGAEEGVGVAGSGGRGLRCRPDESGL